MVNFSYNNSQYHIIITERMIAIMIATDTKRLKNKSMYVVDELEIREMCTSNVDCDYRIMTHIRQFADDSIISVVFKCIHTHTLKQHCGRNI